MCKNTNKEVQEVTKITAKILFLIFLSCLPFLFSLQGNFVFDDSEAIVKNRDVTLNPLVKVFYNDFWGMTIRSNFSHKSYRPLTILSFRLNYFLSGNELDSFHFKITNLICHITCCILLWCFYNKLWNSSHYAKKQAIDIPYYACLLFSTHPVHVEAISGIVGRADLLSATTFFISFVLYNQAIKQSKITSPKYFIMSVIFATLSMLCKENGITVLGFCIMLEIVTRLKVNRRINNHEQRPWIFKHIPLYLNQQSVTRVAILLTCTGILLFGRWYIMGGTIPEFKPIDNPTAFSKDIFTKIATYNYIYFLNLLLLFWPQWSCFDWSMGCVPLIQDVLDFRLLFVLLLYMYGALVIIFLRNKSITRGFKRLACLAVLLMVIPFLPASNIFFPVGFVIAERILYLPSAGHCFLVVCGYNKLLKTTKRSNFSRMLLKLVFFLVICNYAAKSYIRALQWQNEYLLFTSGLAVCPLNAKVHYNVAKVADANGQTAFAISEYEESLRLYPEYYQAMNNLANLLKNRGELDSAENYLKTAIKLKSLESAIYDFFHEATLENSSFLDAQLHRIIGEQRIRKYSIRSNEEDFPAAWMNLGIVLAQRQRFQESEDAYNSALKYRKHYPDCYFNKGNLYLEMKRYDEATESFEITVAIDPKHNMGWTNLLSLLDNMGLVEKSLSMIPRALSELPNSASINFVVANIFGKMDRFVGAEMHFRKAIALFGEKVKAIHYINLGVLYHRWKKYEVAEEMYKTALEIDPSSNSAKKNLLSLKRILDK